ncbi:hypothetical protein [Mesorhizobium sp. L2C067A000]|uniref:hypothetical protein n=1 Tax=Mesorhizobium sp. L2C067A000 TaxID=1287106 RepID=UPI0003CFEDBD|nr:hypothetical protein [Mesorhizobium sp. L2C067A000]ESZ37558.1 hypothetical protein X733_03415 [Mesorhizobium sp. L2C067A000]
MEDLNGGAAAPAETTTVSADPVVTPPAPVSSEPTKADPKPEPKVEEKKAPTAREALKAAAEKVKTDEAEAAKKTPPVQTKPAEKTLPEPKPAKVEAETAAKPAETVTKPEAKPGTTSHAEAPARFKSDTAAMAEWEKAPEPVKAAVHRSIRELEAGIEKHRVSADEFEKVRDFHDLATKNNTTMRDAMTRYTNLERTLLSDPLKGIEAVCDYAGISLRQLAAHVMGQKPDEVQGQYDATVQQLKREIDTLKQSVGGVTSTMQQQHVATVDAQVQKFAAENPRFEELAEDIAFFLKAGRTKDLAEAYKLAEKLNPDAAAPAATVQAAPQTRTAPDPQAQTLKGSKSITGAPSAGSDPATKRASTSIKDSLRRAVAQAG